MYLAGFIVAGFLVAGVYAVAWLRGKRDRYHRAALIVPLTVACARRAGAAAGRRLGRRARWPRTSRSSWPPSRASSETTKGAPFTLGGIYDDGEITAGSTIPDMLSLLAYHDPNATVEGARRVPASDRPPVERRPHTRSRRWSASAPGLALLAASYLFTWLRRKRRLPRSRWFYRRSSIAGPRGGRRADRRLDHDRGRAPAVDRLRGDADEEAVTGADGHPDRLRDPGRRLSRPRRGRRSGSCAAWPRSRSSAELPGAAEAPADGRRPDLARARRSGSPPTRSSAAPTSAPASGT